jgi:pyridoxal phosphate enzyme (YggS family)
MVEAAHRAGRTPDDITLVAISKALPLANVQALYNLGHRHFGENRVTESRDKMRAARETFAPYEDPIVWHMIGHIQSRKAKSVISSFDHIHSLDSVRLAIRLSRFAAEQDKNMPLLLECNVSGDAGKHGFATEQCGANTDQWEALKESVALITDLPNIEIRGLMTMAPIVPNPEVARQYFSALRDLRNRLTTRFPSTRLEQLSMGMTDDFEVAIEEGATMLRVGRAIFGERY